MNKAESENIKLLVHAFDYAAIGKKLVTPDGEILKVNHSICDLLGYQEEEFLQLTPNDITHPDDLEEYNRNNALLLEGNIQYYQMEKRYIDKNGNEIWGLLSVTLVRSFDGDPLYFVNQVQDITQRKYAEQKVIQNQKNYQRLVEESPFAVIIFKNHRPLFVNESAVKLLGAASKERHIGKKIDQFVDPQDLNRISDKLRNSQFGPNQSIEERFIRKDGREIDVEIKSIPTIFEGQSAIHTIIRDITELKKTQELMINSEKLTVVGQLAAGIAHEVKNPLTAIKGFLQLLESNVKDNTYFDTISVELERIETILNELLVLAKPQDVSFKKKNISSIIEHVITLSKGLTNFTKIEVTQTIEPNLPYIYCDENQLKQVFINFIKNAVEAMPKGGTIHIDVKKKDAKSLSIQVNDQGLGIPPETLKRIWEPFFTTKDEGTGLGLMICKQIVESHNGTLQIESNSSGTTVEVVLPLV